MMKHNAPARCPAWFCLAECIGRRYRSGYHFPRSARSEGQMLIFTGQRQDSSVGGLYLMGARWYDPDLNRWIQPDSIVPNPGNPQSLNRCSFASNNPLRYVDKNGHCGPLTPVCVAHHGRERQRD